MKHLTMRQCTVYFRKLISFKNNIKNHSVYVIYSTDNEQY